MNVTLSFLTAFFETFLFFILQKLPYSFSVTIYSYTNLRYWFFCKNSPKFINCCISILRSYRFLLNFYILFPNFIILFLRKITIMFLSTTFRIKNRKFLHSLTVFSYKLFQQYPFYFSLSILVEGGVYPKIYL